MKILQYLTSILVLSSSFLYPLSTFAQKAPKIEWQKCYGGSDNEDADPNKRGFVQTPDGGYCFAHRTHSNDYDVAGSLNHGLDDVWVVKINSLGIIEWQKCIGGSGTDDSWSIAHTSDNGFIFCGYTVSNDGDVTGNHISNIWIPGDAWVVKLDSIGNIEWSKCYGGARREIATSITQTFDGGYIFTGYTNSNDGDVSGNHVLIRSGGFPNDTLYDAWVVKLNNKGKIEWQTCLGGTGDEKGNDIKQTSDSGYIIAGVTYSSDEGFPNYGEGDAYIVKLNKLGGVDWQRIYGGTLQDAASSILQISNGNFIYGGYTNGTFNDYSRPHTGDFWIMELDTLGKKIWGISYGGSNWSYATSIIKTVEGGYTMVGSTYASNKDIIGNHGGSDVCVLKLTATGDKVWQKCLGGSSDEYGYNIFQTPDGGYAINGCTYSNNGDVSGNHLIYSPEPASYNIDVWFVKLSPESNSVEDGNSGQTRFLNAFPNPASEQINLQLSGSLKLKQITFYNLMGAQFYPEYTVENGIATVDVHTLSTGSYVARMVYQDNNQNQFEQVQKFLHYR